MAAGCRTWAALAGGPASVAVAAQRLSRRWMRAAQSVVARFGSSTRGCGWLAALGFCADGCRTAGDRLRTLVQRFRTAGEACRMVGGGCRRKGSWLSKLPPELSRGGRWLSPRGRSWSKFPRAVSKFGRLLSKFPQAKTTRRPHVSRRRRSVPLSRVHPTRATSTGDIIGDQQMQLTETPPHTLASSHRTIPRAAETA